MTAPRPPDAKADRIYSDRIYLQLTKEECPHPWDGQPHLKSACRRCTIEGYAIALRATEQRVWEEAACLRMAYMPTTLDANSQNDPLFNEFRRRATGDSP